ncbi:hypothetical protein FHV95_104378 [Streptomyces coelicolor]|nr:hypothetical protein FHV91_104378 [Streptomyces coelicolor]TYP16046.1 hypothetical protein FHV98_10466 [Streptomyces coelicolor A3(2)]TYP35793.1 hypothetical protein FHV94_10466 [Streptomyces coelicolor]TYP40708.1 hypothetical protein FHV92_10466 [Streptomyces coelicolor]TYP56570.1 hypothetical protein FHV95_104378 [Streptomyces coelicolor]
MTPVVSAVRSCDAATALRHPAAHLFRFLHHHGMLAVGGSPVWRTVTGGSRARVDRNRRAAARRAHRHPGPHGAPARGRRGRHRRRRHPIACDAGPAAAAVSVVSPPVMSYPLIGGSGKRLLERHMADRPGRAEYAARTSGFFPRPPRRPRSA